MWHKTQCTENLFDGRKYLPDPAPPAHAQASVSISLTTFGHIGLWEDVVWLEEKQQMAPLGVHRFTHLAR